MPRIISSHFSRYGVAVSTIGIGISLVILVNSTAGTYSALILLSLALLFLAWYSGSPGPYLRSPAAKHEPPPKQAADSPLQETGVDRSYDRPSDQSPDLSNDQFLALLSHELRNPLAPIRNALHIMRLSTPDDSAWEEAREVVERQVQQLGGVVDDLLDVFRLTHHNITLNRELVDLSELTKKIVDAQRGPLEDSSLHVTLDLGDEPAWVLADRSRLGQVVGNLLRNAGKFTNAGDRITVRVEADRQLRRAHWTVRDTGIGIAAEILPHVFQPFKQAEQSLDRRLGGMGLGLPVVKGLIELHGGAVRASSPGLGLGAEFSFWLPLAVKPRVPNDKSTPLPPTKHLRILIVEDNRDTAKTLGKLLTRYGHEVAVAHSGPAGLEAAHNTRPDIVLCDLGLPEMDGFEVAGALRHDPVTRSARLIAVTGYGQEEDRRRCEEAGFDLHLTKPVDPAELQRLLSEIQVSS